MCSRVCGSVCVCVCVAGGLCVCSVSDVCVCVSFAIVLAAIMTEMWQKIWDDIPEYAKSTLTEQGITNAEEHATGFNTLFAADDRKDSPLLYAPEVAQIVLAFANGTTKYEVGAGVVCAPGCTYHIKDFYQAIYNGWDMVNNPATDGMGRALAVGETVIMKLATPPVYPY